YSTFNKALYTCPNRLDTIEQTGKDRCTSTIQRLPDTEYRTDRIIYGLFKPACDSPPARFKGHFCGRQHRHNGIYKSAGHANYDLDYDVQYVGNKIPDTGPNRGPQIRYGS